MEGLTGDKLTAPKHRTSRLMIVLAVALLMGACGDSSDTASSDKGGSDGATDKSGSGGGTASPTDFDFDKKVLTIASADGSVIGTIGLTKEQNNRGEDYLEAVYNLNVKMDVPLNAKCGPEGSVPRQACGRSYEYGGRLVPVNQDGDKVGNGIVSAVYCNQGQLNPDPYSTSGSGQTLEACGIESTDGLVTDTFAANFQTNFYSYGEIFETTTFEIYSYADFWESVPGEEGAYTSNVDKAVRETSPVVTFEFTVSE